MTVGVTHVQVYKELAMYKVEYLNSWKGVTAGFFFNFPKKRNDCERANFLITAYEQAQARHK